MKTPPSPPHDDATETFRDLGATWRAGAGDDAATSGVLAAVDIGRIRRRARRFAFRVRLRNATEIAAAGLVIALSVGFVARAKDGYGVLVGVVMAAAAAFVAGNVIVRGRALRVPPEDAPTSEHLRVARAQLTRQADLLARVWRWYLGPLGVAILLVYAVAGTRLAVRGALDAAALEGLARGLVPTIALFALLHVANRRAARRLRDELAALPDDAE